ncbi:MAG: hypothetical protein FWE84_04590 [Firmicutes bacterium]|nr:hypothetical protein [Bacillota bacterium]
MEKVERTKDGLLVESGYFDPAATLFSGQCFRVKRTEEGFEAISGDKNCKVRTERIGVRSKTLIITDEPDYFCHYFDLGANYGNIVKSLSGFPELNDDIEAGRGIHILRQQLFETIISFIISANNNIPRIKGIIGRICERFGRQMDGFYAFPTPFELQDVKTEDYAALGAGYRAEYLESTVKVLLNSDVLTKLPQMAYADAVKTLMTLKGVGRKVADCICLFALHHTRCYPVDTWIQKRDGLSANEARKAAEERYGDLAGYAQQYKYYAAIRG